MSQAQGQFLLRMTFVILSLSQEAFNLHRTILVKKQKHLPDHQQKWQGTLKAWVCMGWSLPLVETAESKHQKLVRANRTRRKRRRHDTGWRYLKHDNTDLLDTLNDGLWGPCNCDGTLCWVGQHVSCYLYLSSGWLQTQGAHMNSSVGRWNRWLLIDVLSAPGQNTMIISNKNNVINKKYNNKSK